jgi:hypothetical protein
LRGQASLTVAFADDLHQDAHAWAAHATAAAWATGWNSPPVAPSDDNPGGWGTVGGWGADVGWGDVGHWGDVGDGLGAGSQSASTSGST